MARPRKKIDPDMVEKLAAINCSYAEIATAVGCNSSTLTRRFAQAIERGRDQGRMSLKRKMWETAHKGNVTMMIWLSKQMLGYTDKVEERIEQTNVGKVIINWADEDGSRTLPAPQDVTAEETSPKSSAI